MPSSSSTANQQSLMKKYFSFVCMSVTCMRLKYHPGLRPLLSCHTLTRNKTFYRST